MSSGDLNNNNINNNNNNSSNSNNSNNNNNNNNNNNGNNNTDTNGQKKKKKSKKKGKNEDDEEGKGIANTNLLAALQDSDLLPDILKTTIFKNYGGDLFSTFMDNTDGMLYLSRMNKGYQMSSKLDSDLPQDDTKKKDVNLDSTSEIVTNKRNPYVVERNRRFAISLSTLSAKPDKRGKVFQDGGILALIKLCQSSEANKNTQGFCARAFRNFSIDPTLHKEMIEMGVVPVVVSLSKIHDTKIKTDCAQTFCQLAQCKGLEARLVHDQVVTSLLSLSLINHQIMDISLKTLQNLSCVDDRYQKVEEVNDAVLQIAQLQGLTPAMELTIMKTLTNLSGLKNNQQRLIEESCVRLINGMLETVNDECKIYIAKILSNLTSDARSRSKMTDQNVIPTLLSLIENSDNEEMQQDCLIAVTRLSMDVASREKIVQQGAVLAILTLCLKGFKRIETGRTCALAIRCLATDKELAERLVEGNAIGAIVELVNKFEDLSIRQDCARSLCVLLQYEDSIVRTIRQGALHALVKLSDPKCAVCSAWCASAFYSLSLHDICDGKIIGAAEIGALVSLCTAEKLDTRKRCVVALWSITQKDDIDADNSAIPQLLVLLRDKESDPEIKGVCAAALYNLAREPENCTYMLDEGALDPIIQLSNSSGSLTKIQCGAILSRLSNNKINRKSMISVDYIRVLLDLAYLDDTETQQRSVMALVNLTQEKTARELIMKEAAALCLVKLSSKPDEDIRRGCAAAFCNLAYDWGNEKGIVDTGAVSVILIIALVATDNEQTREICAKALFNLLCDESQHKAMIDDGVIWGLASLSQSKNRELILLCATAFCNLSLNFSNQIVSSSSTRAIFHLLRSEDLETQKLSAQTLVNVLSDDDEGGEQEDQLRQNSVVILGEILVCSKSESIRLLSIACLGLIAQHKSGRKNIIADNALERINMESVCVDEVSTRNYVQLLYLLPLYEDTRSQAIKAGSLRGLVTILQAKKEEIRKCFSDPSVGFLVMRAFYSLSCDKTNLEPMVKEGIIPAVLNLLKLSEISKTMLNLCCVLIYNLSTEATIQADLVTQGTINLIQKYLLNDYTVYIKDKNNEKLVLSSTDKTKYYACVAIFNMACGQVNTSRMVEEGVIEAFKHSSTLTKTDLDFNRRKSAAVRNLLFLTTNQDSMVGQGIIPFIVEIFDLNDVVVKQNCAAALRNISYNRKHREELVHTQAIGVIIQDSKMYEDGEDEDMNLSIELLFEIEAESWSNGSRGRGKEERAAPLARPDLLTHYLALDANSTDEFEHSPLQSKIQTYIDQETGEVVEQALTTVVPEVFFKLAEHKYEWYKFFVELEPIKVNLDITKDKNKSEFVKKAVSNPTIRSKTDFDLDQKCYVMEGGKIDGIVQDEQDKRLANTSNKKNSMTGEFDEDLFSEENEEKEEEEKLPDTIKFNEDMLLSKATDDESDDESLPEVLELPRKKISSRNKIIEELVNNFRHSKAKLERYGTKQQVFRENVNSLLKTYNHDVQKRKNQKFRDLGIEPRNSKKKDTLSLPSIGSSHSIVGSDI